MVWVCGLDVCDCLLFAAFLVVGSMGLLRLVVCFVWEFDCWILFPVGWLIVLVFTDSFVFSFMVYVIHCS